MLSKLRSLFENYLNKSISNIRNAILTRRHPFQTNRLGTFLAKNSLLRLILYYVFLTIGLSLIIGCLYNSLDQNNPDNSLLDWITYTFSQLLGAEPAPDFDANLSLSQIILFWIGSAIGVLLPAVVLGTVIFKLFTGQNTFVFREAISVYTRKDKSYRLTISFYNATNLDIMAVNINAISRRTSGKGGRRLKTLIDNPPKVWLYSNPQIPYRFHINLEPGDVVVNGEKYELVSIKGIKMDLVNEIVVYVSGNVPDLGIDVHQVHTYRIPENVQYGKYSTLNLVEDDKPILNPKDFTGWRDFESTSKKYLQEKNNDILSEDLEQSLE